VSQFTPGSYLHTKCYTIAQCDLAQDARNSLEGLFDPLNLTPAPHDGLLLKII